VKNTVELLGWYGGDETHALSAWTSTSRELDDAKRERIPALLKLLATSSPPHRSPFEKSALHFLVTTDIATHIHLIKHRIGVSCNGESARYKELRDDRYHVPDDWPRWAQVELIDHCERSLELYHSLLERLERSGIPRKRAKESARFVRPYATQIVADVQFNFASFQHFQALRNHDHAQVEVRELARAMLDLVRLIPGEPFKYSLEAFGL
jgi:flavin-dependent thymidylate synthase